MLMLTSNECARLQVSANESRRTLIERRLRRYSPGVQGLVGRMADRHTRLADLAVSFPALLFALAVPRPGVDPERAIASAIQGCSLPHVAKQAGVPLWLRALPVDCLACPLPPLPDDDFFRLRITSHLPWSPKLVPTWLEAVAGAAQWAHEPFAIWIAREL